MVDTPNKEFLKFVYCSECEHFIDDNVCDKTYPERNWYSLMYKHFDPQTKNRSNLCKLFETKSNKNTGD